MYLFSPDIVWRHNHFTKGKVIFLNTIFRITIKTDIKIPATKSFDVSESQTSQIGFASS